MNHVCCLCDAHLDSVTFSAQSTDTFVPAVSKWKRRSEAT